MAEVVYFFQFRTVNHSIHSFPQKNRPAAQKKLWEKKTPCQAMPLSQSIERGREGHEFSVRLRLRPSDRSCVPDADGRIVSHLQPTAKLLEGSFLDFLGVQPAIPCFAAPQLLCILRRCETSCWLCLGETTALRGRDWRWKEGRWPEGGRESALLITVHPIRRIRRTAALGSPERCVIPSAFRFVKLVYVMPISFACTTQSPFHK